MSSLHDGFGRLPFDIHRIAALDYQIDHSSHQTRPQHRAPHVDLGGLQYHQNQACEGRLAVEQREVHDHRPGFDLFGRLLVFDDLGHRRARIDQSLVRQAYCGVSWRPCFLVSPRRLHSNRSADRQDGHRQRFDHWTGLECR